nr:hypothetical protein B0A51_03268 [Rachicladosporium sp. CCFEE 5018]
MADPRPWQYSTAIGGHFIYVPSRDLIVKRDGPQFPRPPHIPKAHPLLQAAMWEDVDSPGAYDARPRRSRVLEDATPRFPDDLATGMNAMNLNARPQQAWVVERGDARTGTLARTAQLPPGAQVDPSLRARGIPGHMLLMQSEGDTERLDPSYKKRSGSFFRVGRIFMTLWPEAVGENNSRITSLWDPDPDIYLGAFGERFHTKVRRFVIIRTSDKHCSALPITTYNGRGVSKPGVIKSEHAIIHTGKTCPNPLEEELPDRGEAGMRLDAIRVDPDDRNTKLDPMSRIDFGKVHTVEHYVKAKSFGNVHERSMPDLIRQFDSVWRKDSIVPVPQQPSASSSSAISADTLRSWKVALLQKGYTPDQVRAKLLTMLHERSADTDDEEEEEEEEEDDDDDDDESGAEEDEARQDDAEVEEEDLYGPG